MIQIRALTGISASKSRFSKKNTGLRLFVWFQSTIAEKCSIKNIKMCSRRTFLCFLALFYSATAPFNFIISALSLFLLPQILLLSATAQGASTQLLNLCESLGFAGTSVRISRNQYMFLDYLA